MQAKRYSGIGLKIINLPIPYSVKNIKEEPRTLYYLFKLYEKEKPDVVYHVSMKTILWGTLAEKFSKKNGVVNNDISGLRSFFAEDNKGLMARIMPKVL